MSRFTDARLELAFAIDDDPIGRRDEIADLREEIAVYAPLFVRRYQAAMAFITAEQVYQRTGTGEAYRALEAARVARRQASDACDRAVSR